MISAPGAGVPPQRPPSAPPAQGAYWLGQATSVCPVLSARGRAGGRRQAPAASLDARAEGIMGIRSRPGSNCTWLQVTDSARSPVVRRIFLTLNPRKSKYTRSLTYYSSNTTILHRQSLYAAIDQHDPLPILRNPSTSIQSVTAVARLAHHWLMIFYYLYFKNPRP